MPSRTTPHKTTQHHTTHHQQKTQHHNTTYTPQHTSHTHNHVNTQPQHIHTHRTNNTTPHNAQSTTDRDLETKSDMCTDAPPTMFLQKVKICNICYVCNSMFLFETETESTQLKTPSLEKTNALSPTLQGPENHAAHHVTQEFHHPRPPLRAFPEATGSCTGQDCLPSGSPSLLHPLTQNARLVACLRFCQLTQERHCLSGPTTAHFPG